MAHFDGNSPTFSTRMGRKKGPVPGIQLEGMAIVGKDSNNEGILRLGAPALVPLMLVIVIALPLLSSEGLAWNSGAPSDDVGLAAYDFTRKGLDVAKATKGFPRNKCPGTNTSPQMAAAGHMSRANLDSRVSKIMKAFGRKLLGAAGDAFKMVPGGAAVSSSAELLNTWSESSGVGDFASRLLTGKAEEKAGDALKKATDEHTAKLAMNIYRKIEETLQDQEDFIIGDDDTTPAPGCAPGGAKFEIRVSFKKQTIEVKLKADCLCPTASGIDEYGGILKGKLLLSTQNKVVRYKFAGTGMKFWGRCCNGKGDKTFYTGSFRNPKADEFKAPPGPKGECVDATQEECRKYMGEMRTLSRRLGALTKRNAELKQEWPQHPEIADNGLKISSLKGVMDWYCRCWANCQFILDRSEAEKHDDFYNRVCRKKQYGHLPGEQSRFPTGKVAAGTALAVGLGVGTYALIGGDGDGDGGEALSQELACWGVDHGSGSSLVTLLFSLTVPEAGTWNISLAGPGGYRKEGDIPIPVSGRYQSRAEIFSYGSYSWSSTLTAGGESSTQRGDFQVTSSNRSCP